MSTLGLESVLVSDVLDGVGLSVLRVYPAEGSLDAEDGAVLVGAGSTDLLDLSHLVALLAIAQLIGVFVVVETDVVMEELLDKDDASVVLVLFLLGSGEGDGHEGGENDEL